MKVRDHVLLTSGEYKSSLDTEQRRERDHMLSPYRCDKEHRGGGNRQEERPTERWMVC